MDKLNLTPQERRLVAGVGLVVFVILNIWLVWPHFGDWRKVKGDREKAERTLARYQKEVERVPSYQARLRDLENQGQSIVAEEQDVDLANTVLIQSQISHVEITDNRDVRSTTTVTNQFFDEKARRIVFKAGNEELVNFLTSLTSTNSLIRVRDMTVSPDPPNNPVRLSGNITLVASYQRKAPAKAVPAVAATDLNAVPAPVTTAVKTLEPAGKGTGSAAISKQVSAPRSATNKSSSATGTNVSKAGASKPRTIPTPPKS